MPQPGGRSPDEGDQSLTNEVPGGSPAWNHPVIPKASPHRADTLVSEFQAPVTGRNKLQLCISYLVCRAARTDYDTHECDKRPGMNQLLKYLQSAQLTRPEMIASAAQINETNSM